MQVFEINILRKAGDSWPVVVEHSQPDLFLPVRIESILQLSVEELHTQVMPLEYGTLLGKALFHEQVRDALMVALAGPEKQVRVLLYVEAKDLQALHWERLCAPLDGGWAFLAANQRTPFSLYLPAVTDRRFPPIGRPDLCALVVVASPQGLNRYGMAPFDEAAVARSVTQALGDIPYALLTNLPAAAGPPTLDAFCDQIVAQRYTLVHVVCHGRYDHASGETSLFLANDHNEVDRVDATRLIERLRRLDNARGLPHLVFLAACDTAHPEAEAALGGLAQRLVRELGMPAVIAMSDQVTLETVERLTTTFYRKLADRGEVDVALGEASSLLAHGSDLVVPALYSRLGERALFSEALDRPLTNSQIAKGLDRLTQYLLERAPVFQPKFYDLAQTLRATLSTEDQVLSAERRSERTPALDALNTICVEVLDISFASLALGKQPPTYDARCPFRGLGAFRLEDHAFFFGREPLVREMTARVKQEQFLAVLGPSGCGKSSLVLAGVVPLLQTEQPALRVLTMTPGAQPVERLEAMLGVVPALSQPTIVVVDQFEELFTLCQDDKVRRQFVDRLLELLKPAATGDLNSRPLIIVTLRADFLSECTQYPGLRAILQTQQALIGPMSLTELRNAMEQQASMVRLRFEPDLVNTILDDVADEPAIMPLLQHALLELWQRRHGRWLKAEEYRAMGGVRNAIAHSAEEMYSKLDEADRKRIRLLMIRLTRLDDSGDRRDTRRRLAVDDLAADPVEQKCRLTLVRRLADARLVVTDVDPVTNFTEVEMAHEALVNAWGRLRQWLNEGRAGLLLRQQLEQDVGQWVKNTRDISYVYRDRRLATTKAWASANRDLLNLDEHNFLQAGEKQQQKTRQRRILFIGTIILMPILVSVAVAYVARIGPFFPAVLTWTPVKELGQARITDLDWGADGTLYAAYSPEGETIAIGARAPGDQQWQLLTLPITGTHWINNIVVMNDDPNRLYTGLFNAGLWQSSNRGVTWTPTRQEWRANSIFLTQSKDGRLYAGGDMPIQMLLDATDVWRPVIGAPEEPVYYLSWQDDELLAGTGKQLLVLDNSLRWTTRLAALSPNSVVCYEDVTYVATYQGLFLVPDSGHPQKMSERTLLSTLLIPGVRPLFLGGTDNGALAWWRWGELSVNFLDVGESLGGAQDIYTLSQSPNEPGVIWAATDKGLFRSDAGAWIAEHSDY